MADHHHYLNRISLPTTTTPTPRAAYPYPPTTPSKHRRSKSAAAKSFPTSAVLLLLFSLRSLYSLLPFLRSSPPSFSIFPFSFIVSLLSFFLTLTFSLLAANKSPIFSLSKLTRSQHKLLLVKSLLLAVVFLLRFQALMYCGTAAMILAELSGNLAARFMAEGNFWTFLDTKNSIGLSKVRGFIALISGLILLSFSWDRIECFPLSHVNVSSSRGFSLFPSGGSSNSIAARRR